MKNTRRKFLTKSALGATFFASAISSCQANPQIDKEDIGNKYEKLDDAVSKPIIDTSLFSEPLIIETLELLRYKNNFICKIRTADGAEGISVSNNAQMISLYPIFINRLQPFFIGKDARKLEALLEEVSAF